MLPRPGKSGRCLECQGSGLWQMGLAAAEEPWGSRAFLGTTGWQVATAMKLQCGGGKHHVTQSQLGGRLLHPPSAWELKFPLTKGGKKKKIPHPLEFCLTGFWLFPRSPHTQ